MSRLSDINEVRIPRRFLTRAMLHLWHVGRQGLEGFALWAGIQNGGLFDVTDTIIPKQHGMKTSRGICVTIPPEELHRINVWLYQNSRILIAQIHSHPTDAYHSELDDEMPIATTIGSFSIVVPDFARQPFDFRSAAIYRLNHAGKWIEVPIGAAEQLLKFMD